MEDEPARNVEADWGVEGYVAELPVGVWTVVSCHQALLSLRSYGRTASCSTGSVMVNVE